jgi:hypothetical protein
MRSVDKTKTSLTRSCNVRLVSTSLHTITADVKAIRTGQLRGKYEPNCPLDLIQVIICMEELVSLFACAVFPTQALYHCNW